MSGLHIGWPQAIWLVLILTSAGKSATRFGETKKPDTYDIADVLIAPVLMTGLLYWGGFFG